MLLGDREFCSKHLATWLLEIGWGYCLRLKKTTYVQLDNDELVTLNQLASVPGISIFLRGVNISKTLHKFPFNLAVHYPREHHGMPVEEGWFLLTTFSDLNTAFDWGFLTTLVSQYVMINRHKIDCYVRGLDFQNRYLARS